MLHKQIYLRNYEEFYQKSALGFGFGPWEVPQPENT